MNEASVYNIVPMENKRSTYDCSPGTNQVVNEGVTCVGIYNLKQSHSISLRPSSSFYSEISFSLCGFLLSYLLDCC
jgi:hypothetical protein